VELIATTDDTADDLKWHKMIADDSSIDVKLVPTFRPDRALYIYNTDFNDYIKKLSDSSGMVIKTIDDLKCALSDRMDFFDGLGCRSSDHGMERVPFVKGSEEIASVAFRKALAGEPLGSGEAEAYQTALLLFLGKAYAERNWVMQLHYGVVRNLNARMLRLAGPDAGFDAISGRECGANIPALLDAMGETLPKTVLYSINPNDNAMLDTVCGAFTESGVRGKVQHGIAWWFNDTKQGMEDHMISLAARGLLGGFIGMLTDSRSLLSYTRHEYFRRILCNMLGAWAENGEYPADIPALGKTAQAISYYNTKHYFGF
jgi:glucuronate isomerase